MIFLDSNIVIDLIEGSTSFSAWSRAAIARQRRGTCVANMVVFAECADHFESAQQQLDYFNDFGIGLVDLAAEGARRAGRAHRAYRRAGGKSRGVLADFLIGGHAASLGATLLTRDRQRFASYFPDLTLFTPETHP